MTSVLTTTDEKSCPCVHLVTQLKWRRPRYGGILRQQLRDIQRWRGKGPVRQRGGPAAAVMVPKKRICRPTWVNPGASGEIAAVAGRRLVADNTRQGISRFIPVPP